MTLESKVIDLDQRSISKILMISPQTPLTFFGRGGIWHTEYVVKMTTNFKVLDL